MADYKKMYTVLCKALDEVIDPLENIPSAKQYANILCDALNAAEEIYINTSLYAENPDDSKIIYQKRIINNCKNARTVKNGAGI